MAYGEARAIEPRIKEVSFMEQTPIADVDGLRLWFEDPGPDVMNPAVTDRALLEGIVVFDSSRSDGGVKPY